MHRLALRALPRAFAPARHACRAATAARSPLRFYSDSVGDRPGAPPTTDPSPGTLRQDGPDKPIQHNSPTVNDDPSGAEEDEVDVAEVALAQANIERAFETGDTSELSEEEFALYELAKVRRALDTGDATDLSPEELAKYESYVELVNWNEDPDAVDGDEDAKALNRSLARIHRALQSGDTSDLSPEELARYEAALDLEELADEDPEEDEDGENGIELPERWHRAHMTGDTSYLDPEELAEYQKFTQELGDDYRAEVPLDDLPEETREAIEGLPEHMRAALETGDFSQLSEDERAVLESLFSELAQTFDAGSVPEDVGEHMPATVDTSALPPEQAERVQTALDTGDYSQLTDDDKEFLAKARESEDLAAAETDDPETLDDGDGDTADVFNADSIPRELVAALPEDVVQQLPAAIQDDLKGDVPLSTQDYELLLERLDEAGHDTAALRDHAFVKVPVDKLDYFAPRSIPKHWAAALETGDTSAIPRNELPYFEHTKSLIYAKHMRDEPDQPDTALPVLREEIEKALATGDTSGLSEESLKRIDEAAAALRDAQSSSQWNALDDMKDDAGGSVLDPTGGPGRTAGRRVGPDDIFTTQEIKYLAERKRLEAIDRGLREKPRWMEPPEQLERPFEVPVAVVHFRSHELPLIELYIHFVTHAAAALGIPCSKPAFLPRQRSLWTVPKSPFVHKKAQQNFHRITHKRAIKLWDATSEVVSFFVDYILRHTLGGVGVRIVRWDRARVDVGQQVWMNAQKHPKSHGEILADTTRRVRNAEKAAAKRLKEAVDADQKVRHAKRLRQKAFMEAEARAQALADAEQASDSAGETDVPEGELDDAHETGPADSEQTSDSAAETDVRTQQAS